MVPDDALIFRDGKPFVPVVRDDHLKLAPVTLGYDNGINVEITDGISDGRHGRAERRPVRARRRPGAAGDRGAAARGSLIGPVISARIWGRR